MPYEIVAPIKAIVDLFTTLAGRQTIRIVKTFEEIVVPIHDNLIEIHSDYRKMFLETQYTCLKLSWDRIPDQQRFIDCKQNLHKARMERDSLRLTVRQEASTIFGLSKHQPTRRYLASVIHYFLEEQDPAPSDERLDEIIETVIKVGGQTYYDTPSLRLELDLHELSSPTAVKELIDAKLIELNDRFAETCTQFIRLKYSMTQL